jgi:D-amino peptidase
MVPESPRVLIIDDMEGICGVDHWHAIAHGFDEFEDGRIQITEDVNAAIRGLRAAGAGEIIVVDAHGSGGANKNLIPEKLETGVELHQEPSTRDRLRKALDRHYDAAVFIGFHAMADTEDGFIPHTITFVPRIKVNGIPVGETAITAYTLGEYGIPVVMVTGDQALVREARRFLPGVEAVKVKTSSSKRETKSLPTVEARELIEEAATRAVSKIGDSRLLTVNKPVEIEMSFPNEDYADIAARLPRTTRIGNISVSYTAENWAEALTFIYAAIDFSSQVDTKALVGELRKLPGSEETSFRAMMTMIERTLKIKLDA